jgi:hypothetical protein
VEAGPEVDLQLHFLLIVEEAGNARVLLGREGDGRHAPGLGVVPRPGRLHPEHAPFAVRERHERGDFLVHGELGGLLAELAAAGVVAAGGVALRRDLIVGQLRQLFIRVALECGLVLRLHLLRLGGHDDRAGELSLVLLEVFLRLQLHLHDLAANGTAGGGRPGHRERVELLCVGDEHAYRAVVGRPAAAELVRLEMGVGEAHLRQLVTRPLVGLLHARRAGQSRADAVGERSRVVHDFRVAKAFLADAGDGGEVLCGEGERGQQRHGQPQLHSSSLQSMVDGMFDFAKSEASISCGV